MSTFSSSNPDKIHKNSLHWRNNSGELDVFEAAKYFSSSHDQISGYININANCSQKPVRRSIDMPTGFPQEYHQKQIKDQKKKYKQPSSPGGRLASFLNSLFNQPYLKAKKSKSGKLEDETPSGPGGRRKRRISISHFSITNTDSKSLSSSSNSGFRSTPPPYADTPIKSYRKFSELFKNSENLKPSLLDGAPEKVFKNFGFPGRSSDANRVGEFRKFSDVDHDGGDSDSSSDLFDLPNHELDFYSSSLPVYETTHMDRIKIVAPMSSTTTVK